MDAGDDVSAIVIDAGAYETKAGYAGDDMPKAVFRSAVLGKPRNQMTPNEKPQFLTGNALDVRRDNMDVYSFPFPKEKGKESGTAPTGPGLVGDWDCLQTLWDYAFSSLQISPNQHPILLAEPSFNTRYQREKATEQLFENYQIPALFMAKSGVLSTFATGKSSALVLECGGGTTTVTPVYEGYVLRKGVVSSQLAGNWLSQALLKQLTGKGVTIRPRYLISKHDVQPGQFVVEVKDFPHVTQSYHNYTVNNIVDDIKKEVFRVSGVPLKDLDSVAAGFATRYELPDGNSIELPVDYQAVPELLFNPNFLPDYNPNDNGSKGIVDMMCTSISKCDVDVRVLLLQNLLLTGGCSLIPNFCERLNNDLMAALPQHKGKVTMPPSPFECKFSVFIGGSILASLGSFQQLWISHKEYEEVGMEIVSKKCP